MSTRSSPRTSARRARSRSCSSRGGRRSNVGVTSGGDLFGGTQVTFTDVLGDKQFNLFAASVSQYRTMSFSYINLSRRLQYAAAGLLADAVLLRLRPGLLYGSIYGYIDRDDALATQTARGGTALRHLPVQPLRAPRAVGRPPAVQQDTTTRACRRSPTSTRSTAYGRVLFSNGTFMPLGVNLVQRDDGLPRVRTARRQHDVARLRVRADVGRPALAADRRRRRPLLPAARHQRRARVARARLQELGRVPRLPVLRRQLRTARLRLPGVPRQQGLLHQRRAALPAHRGGADADRRHRRPARRVLLQLRRLAATTA